MPSFPQVPLDPLTLTLIGLGVATFFYFLMFISPLLQWGVSGNQIRVSAFGFEVSSASIGTVAGIHFGDGRMLFCLCLVMTGLVALNFLDRRFLPQIMVGAGALATFVFLMMLGRVWAGGAGIYVGLFGALGAAAACIWVAVRQPLVLDTPLIRGGPSFFRTYGALLAAHAIAVGFGVLYWFIRAVASAA